MHLTPDSNHRKFSDDRKHWELIRSYCGALCHWEEYFNPEQCDENQVSLEMDNFCSKCTCIIICDWVILLRNYSDVQTINI